MLDKFNNRVFHWLDNQFKIDRFESTVTMNGCYIVPTRGRTVSDWISLQISHMFGPGNYKTISETYLDKRINKVTLVKMYDWIYYQYPVQESRIVPRNPCNTQPCIKWMLKETDRGYHWNRYVSKISKQFRLSRIVSEYIFESYLTKYYEEKK